MEQTLVPILPIPKKDFQDLTITEYNNYFTKTVNSGGAISDIILYQKDFDSNNLLRRGGSFWTFLGNIAKKTLPFIHKYILPEAVNFGQNLIEKTNQTNSNLTKQDLKKLSKQSLSNIAKKIAVGSGERRQKKKEKQKQKQKQKGIQKIQIQIKKIQFFQEYRLKYGCSNYIFH